MKYLRKYENIQNLKEDDYIIITSNIGWLKDNFYVLAKIEGIKDEYFLIEFIDNIPNHMKAEKTKKININTTKPVFSSPSLEEAKREFEKLEKELIVKKDAKKYNL